MAKIADLLATSRTSSFEFFPPKSDAERATLAATIGELEGLRPSFISVTYRGGASSRKRTFDLVTELASTAGLVSMAHLICVAHTERELIEILEAYGNAGIVNLMALGGDPPSDPADGPGELTYASELVELARRVGDFSIGVAAHPLGHPRSRSLTEDRDHLAAKLALADFAVTQFFFDPADYVNLVTDLADRGVTKPIVPGIMPVTSLSSIPRMAEMGAALPPEMIARLVAADERGGPEAVRAVGIALATELCAAVLDHGAPGLHYYTLNRSTATREIAVALATR